MMRPVVLVLAVALGACSTPRGSGVDPTSTTEVPLITTTSTTEAPDIETTATTGTTVEECAERDGVLMTGRGFVCPPYVEIGPDEDSPSSTGGEFSPKIYLPGEYVTRAFQPTLSFSRSESFGVWGEWPDEVTLDISEGRGITYGLSGSKLADLEELVVQSWVTLLEESQIEVGGQPATRTDYVVGDECEQRPYPRCYLDVGDRSEPTFQTGGRVTIVIIDVGGRRMAIYIKISPAHIDSYLAEVAQPILDSIEFHSQ